MALQLSDAVLNAAMNAFEAAIGTAPVLEIRSALPPANCAAADAGTLLASLTLPNDWLTDSAAGVKSLLGAWEDPSVNASGTAGHFRIKKGSVCHVQGTVSATGLGGDLQLATVLLVAGQGVEITAFTIAAQTSALSTTEMLDEVVTGGVTWRFYNPAGTERMAIPVGTSADGRRFAASAQAFSFDTLPASRQIIDGGGQMAWIDGLELNPGCEGSQYPGRSNSGRGGNSLHGLSTARGYPLENESIAGQLSPPLLTQGGYVLNRDPGYTGQKVAVAAGFEGAYGKALCAEAPASMTARMLEYHVLDILRTALPQGALGPPPADPIKAPVLLASDIDLSGLPSLPLPSGAPAAGGAGSDYHHAVLTTETQRYNRAVNQQAGYGRDIAVQASGQALRLLGLDPLATKAINSLRFCRDAIGVGGRIRQGGIIGGATTGGYGGQVHCWPLIVAVAAWLTRNSPRGQYFRDLLSGALASQFNAHFGAPRVITDADWSVPITVWTREAPDGNIDPGYFSHQPRPGMRGNVWGHPDITQPGSGLIGQRMGQRDYMWLQYGSALGLALFLSRVPGGRDLVPYPNYWRWMDQVADMAIWNRQFSNSSGTGGVGQYKTEAYLRGSDMSNFVENALIDPNIGWPFQTGDAPAVTAVEFSPGYELLRERGDGNPTYAVEQIVSLHTNRTLSRNPAWLPVKEAFTVTRNGVPVVIDTAGASLGDARDIGAIQIRDRTIMLFLAEPLQTGDQIRVWTNFAGNAASRPRTPAGELLADIPESAPLQATAVLRSTTRPNPQDIISFGGFDQAAGEPDAPKYFYINRNANYLSQRFGIDIFSARLRRILIGVRGRMAPGGLSRQGSGFIAGHRVASTSNGIFTNGNGLNARFASPTGKHSLCAIGGVFSAADDAVPGQANGYSPRTWWFDASFPVGSAPVLRARNQDTVLGPAIGGVAWTDEADIPTLGGWMTSRINCLGVYQSASDPTPLNPLRYGLLEMAIMFGIDDRPLDMPADGLANPIFAPDYDWGPRGARLFPSRANYPAGGALAGIPEIYISPQLQQVRSNSLPNVGAWTMTSGIYSDPEQTRTWTKLGEVAATQPDFTITGTSVVNGWNAPVVGALSALNAPNSVFSLVGDTPFVILED